MDSSHDQFNNDHHGMTNLAIDIVLFPEPSGGEPWSCANLPFGSLGTNLTFWHVLRNCWSILAAAASKDSVG